MTRQVAEYLLDSMVEARLAARERQLDKDWDLFGRAYQILLMALTEPESEVEP